jgi:hypothetical protein
MRNVLPGIHDMLSVDGPSAARCFVAAKSRHRLMTCNLV